MLEEELISKRLEREELQSSLRQEEEEWKPYQETSSRNDSVTSNLDPDMDLGWATSFPSSSTSNSAVHRSQLLDASDDEPNADHSSSFSTPQTKRVSSSKKHSSPLKHNNSSPGIIGLPSKFYQPHLRHRISSNGFSSPRISSSSSRQNSERLVEGSIQDQSKEEDDEADLDLDIFDDVRNEGLDWKSLFIVSSNWAKGNFLVSELLNETPRRFKDRSADEVDLRSQVGHEKGKGKAIQEEEKVHEQIDQKQDSSFATASAPASPSDQVSFKSLKSSIPNNDSESGPSRALTLVQASHFSPLVFTASRIPVQIHDDGKDHSLFPKVQIYHPETGQDKKSTDAASGRILTSSLGSMTPALRTLERLKAPVKEARIHQEISITEIRSDSIDRSQGLLNFVGFRGDESGDDENELRGRKGGERLLVCYESKSLLAAVVFRVWIDHDFKIQYLEEASTFTNRNHSPSSVDRIVASAFSSPILVTCSVDFKVKIYRIISPSPHSTSTFSRLDLVQQMKSFSCEWPANFQLRQVPIIQDQTNKRRKTHSSELISSQDPHPEMVFKLLISFCSPSYPTNWSVSLQEVIIHLPTIDPSNSSVKITTRHATATNTYSYSPLELGLKNQSEGNSLERGSTFGSSWTFDQENLGMTPRRKLKDEEDARSKSKILSVTSDSDWVVIGRRDNLLECYEVIGGTKSIQPFSSNGKTSGTRNDESLSLNHRSVVYGHLGSVQSVALDDGRCVSGSSDGSVIVWSLLRRDAQIDQGLQSSSWKGLRNRRMEKEVNPSSLGKRKWVEEEEAEVNHQDQPPEISRVVTLRSSPSRAEQTSNSSSHSTIPTLHDLLVQSRQFKSRSASRPNIRWVGSSFDKVLSVIQDFDDRFNLEEDGSEMKEDRMVGRDEQVQIWSFSG